MHVNRILQDLRAEDIIAIDRRAVNILDWDGLRSIGQFDPAYLHLRDGASDNIGVPAQLGGR